MLKVFSFFLMMFFMGMTSIHCNAEERMRDSSEKVYFYYNKNAKVIASNIIFAGNFSFVALDLQFPDGKLVKCMKEKNLRDNFKPPYIVPEIEFIPIESDSNCIQPGK